MSTQSDMIVRAAKGGLAIDPYGTIRHGRPTFVIVCACGRQHSAHLQALRALENCGWRCIPHANAVYAEIGCVAWMCPFCAGTEAQLRRVFDKAEQDGEEPS